LHTQKTSNIFETVQDRTIAPTLLTKQKVAYSKQTFDCCRNQRPWTTLNGHHTHCVAQNNSKHFIISEILPGS